MMDIELKAAMQGYVNGDTASNGNVGTPIKLREKSYQVIESVVEKFLESSIGALKKAEARSEKELVNTFDDMERKRIERKLSNMASAVNFLTNLYKQVKERAEAIKAKTLLLGPEYQEMYDNGQVSQKIEQDIELVKTTFDTAQKGINAYKSITNDVSEKDQKYIFDTLDSEKLEQQVNEVLSKNDDINIDEVREEVLAAYENKDYQEVPEEISEDDINDLLEPATLAELEGKEASEDGLTQEEIEALMNPTEEEDILDSPEVQSVLEEARRSIERASASDESSDQYGIGKPLDDLDVKITAAPMGDDLSELGEDINIEQFTGRNVANLELALEKMKLTQARKKAERDEKAKELEATRKLKESVYQNHSELSEERDKRKEQAEKRRTQAKLWKVQAEEAARAKKVYEQMVQIYHASQKEDEEISKLAIKIAKERTEIDSTKEETRKVIWETQEYDKNITDSSKEIAEQRELLKAAKSQIQQYKKMMSPQGEMQSTDAISSGGRRK